MSLEAVKLLLIGEAAPGKLPESGREVGQTHGVTFVLEKVPTLSEGIVRLLQEDVQVVFLHLFLPDSQGLKTFTHLHSRCPTLSVVVIVDGPHRQTAEEALVAGAQDYLMEEQVDPDLLVRTARYALERKQVDQLKDEFVSTISHELRTPLSIIKEGTSLILDGLIGPVSDEQGKILRISRENIDRLAHIIDNMLDIANLDMGRMVLKKQPVNLAELIRGAAAPFEAKAREKGIELRMNLPVTPVEVEADPLRLTQIFAGLLENAVKFTSEGGVEISVSANGDCVTCQVSDTGVGIPAEDLPKLFRRFQQFGRKYGPGEQGTGLGLAIAKQLVELHGGSVQVQSRAGQGTQIAFVIPRKAAA